MNLFSSISYFMLSLASFLFLFSSGKKNMIPNDASLLSLSNCQVLAQQLKTEQQIELDNLSYRYEKGIDIIRIIYEKILSLEHHFSGLQTHQNITDLSNPHTYPGFQKNRDLIEKKLNKRFSFQVPAFLDTNPYVATTYSLVASLLGSGDSKEKQQDFEDIACILDFTVRMNTDLRVINGETGFLSDAVQQLKSDCESLFQEYTKPVGYDLELPNCREEDDWDNIKEQLRNLKKEIRTELEEEVYINSKHKKIVDLDFSTRRVTDYIVQYSDFIKLSTQYYQKFNNIIMSYDNEVICRQQLPRQFIDLRTDVQTTLQKFNNTYNLPELKGSRLKDLLYGI